MKRIARAFNVAVFLPQTATLVAVGGRINCKYKKKWLVHIAFGIEKVSGDILLRYLMKIIET